MVASVSSISAIPFGEDSFITPGLVDIQVNGFAGIDFNHLSLTPEKFDIALQALLESGVTKVFPTLISAPLDILSRRLCNLDKVVCESKLGRLMVEGYHLEGPFLSPVDGFCGCHPKQAMIPASIEVFDNLQQMATFPIVIMTVAPERPHVLSFIKTMSKRGLVCALGHTEANREIINQAVDAGAVLATHLGNGIPHQMDKNDNPFVAQLGHDDLFASFIADGVHIPPDMLKCWIRSKEISRTILTTDATAGAGKYTHEGIYTLGDLDIQRNADGVLRKPDSPYLTGSAIWMEKMVENVVQWYQMPFIDILKITRYNALSLLGKNKLLPCVGDMADFITWQIYGNRPQIKKIFLGPWVCEVYS